MQVKERLQDTLELEKDADLDGENAQRAVINDEVTVAFVDDAVDRFMDMVRPDAYSVTDTEFVVKEEDTESDGTDEMVNEQPVQKTYFVRFHATNEERESVSTLIRPRMISEIAVAVGESPDRFLNGMEWQMFGDCAPVMFEVPTEGWVVISPVIYDDVVPADADSFTDFVLDDGGN